MSHAFCITAFVLAGALGAAFAQSSGSAQPDDDSAPPPRIRAWMDRLTVKHAYDAETGFIVAREVIELPPILAEAPPLDEALNLAEDKVVVAFTTADRCAPCQQYKRSALNDPRVIEALGDDRLVATHLEVDRDPQMALDLLGSLAIPMTYALFEGDRIAVLRGQRSPEELLAWLETLPRDRASAELLRATNAWHANRLRGLKAADGWLALVGLEWLADGENMVGSAPDAGVQYAGFPADDLGTIHVDDAAVRFTPATTLPDSLEIEGLPEGGVLRVDSAGSPTVLKIGDIRFHVIERGGKLAVRIKDANAPTRTGFKGIDRYPVSADWVVPARFEPASEGHELELETVAGVDVGVEVAGWAHFEVDGHPCRAVLSPASSGAFYLRFGDGTNRNGTYPIGRYLKIDPPAADGSLTLDFNRSFNPPCAFTPFATCTMPPEPNDFPFPVSAGERWENATP